MINEQEERQLIDLLSRHDTPTEAVRKALKADACEITLTFKDKTVVVRDAAVRI